MKTKQDANLQLHVKVVDFDHTIGVAGHVGCGAVLQPILLQSKVQKIKRGAMLAKGTLTTMQHTAPAEARLHGAQQVGQQHALLCAHQMCITIWIGMCITM